MTGAKMEAMLIMMPVMKKRFEDISTTLADLGIDTLEAAEASGLLTSQDLGVLRMGLAQLNTHGKLLDMNDLAEFAGVNPLAA